jgi:hypothetical protein
MKLPRYSLRTFLIVVMVIGAWLGWKVHRVQVRKDWLARIEAEGGRIHWSDISGLLHWEDPHISWFRKLLGDRPVVAIVVIVSDRLDKEKAAAEYLPIKAAFPEAKMQTNDREVAEIWKNLKSQNAPQAQP